MSPNNPSTLSRRWIPLIVLVLCCALAATAAAHTVLRDVEYAYIDGISLQLDLYLPDPKPEKAVPLVIWVHGGGWRAGSKDQTIAPAALGEDYAIASVEYRLTGVAIFPAQIHDVKAAVRWLRSHAGNYGFDPQQFGAWGSSAGGHLVALLGVSCGNPNLEGTVGEYLDESSCVQAVCDFYGPTDFLALLEQRGGRDPRRPMPEDQLIGGLVEDHPALAMLASPISHVSPEVPPFLIMHGSEDPIVPVEQSIAFDEALRAVGIDSTLIVIDGAGHGFSREHLVYVKPFFDRWLLSEGGMEISVAGDVSAFHRDGQTFLTWSESGEELFSIHRSDAPLQALGNLRDDNRLAIVPASSSRNAHASTVEKRDIYYVIEAGEPPLDSSTGLLVHTAVESDIAYYAVATCTADGKILAWLGSVGPVEEHVDLPRPVLQSEERVREHVRAHYVHWAPHVDTWAAQALCNRPHFAFDFVVWEPVEPVVEGAALFALHGGGGTYVNAVPPPTHPQLTVVCPESLIPGDLPEVDRTWDAWYGYNESVGTGQPLSEGVNNDYTTRRLRWMAEWLIDSHPNIDSHRLFLRGSSMGGVGTVFSAIMLRDVFAGGLAIVPRFDYGAEDVFLESFETFGTRWGAVGDNLLTSDGMGIFDRLDAGYLARSYPDWDFAPVWTFNGRNDTAVGWSEKIPFYETMNDTRHGWAFFWDLRAHGGQYPYPKEWRENGWEDLILDWLIANVRLDQSYPAFSNCSIDHDSGDGDVNDGDPIGTINGYLQWDPTSIEDSEYRWSIVLSLHPDAPGSKCTVDVTPRRLQTFAPSPGMSFQYEVLSNSGDSLASGSILVDGNGIVTVLAVPVSVLGTRLVLTSQRP